MFFNSFFCASAAPVVAVVSLYLFALLSLSSLAWSEKFKNEEDEEEAAGLNRKVRGKLYANEKSQRILREVLLMEGGGQKEQ